MGASVKRVLGISKAIDKVSNWCGRISSYLILTLMGVMVVEVVMRYLFKKPTFFAYDMSWMLFGAYIALGAGYSHLHKAHVRIDYFYVKIPQPKRSIFELILNGVFFFPLFTVLIIYLADNVIYSWTSGERASASIWRPPVYPFKTFILLGFVVLYFQAVSEVIKTAYICFKGQSDEH
jgi:TRAP-type mannitol/chloroaromatic compound transport system permease small subunit